MFTKLGFVVSKINKIMETFVKKQEIDFFFFFEKRNRNYQILMFLK